MIKAAMFDTKSFDKESFAPLAEEAGISIKYFETKLGADTAEKFIRLMSFRSSRKIIRILTL